MSARSSAAGTLPRRQTVRVQMSSREKVPLRAWQVEVKQSEEERQRCQPQPHDEANQVEIGPAHDGLRTERGLLVFCATIARTRSSKPGAARIDPKRTTAPRVSF